MNIRYYKKLYYICNDDNGKKIYAGDTVEVRLAMETKTSYQSVVYFNMLDGAYIDAHPGHIKMGLSTHRSLGDYLNQKEIPMHTWGVDEPEMVRGFCKKVKSFYKE
jgi:hypothetical protein